MQLNNISKKMIKIIGAVFFLLRRPNYYVHIIIQTTAGSAYGQRKRM